MMIMIGTTRKLVRNGGMGSKVMIGRSGIVTRVFAATEETPAWLTMRLQDAPNMHHEIFCTVEATEATELS